MIPIKEKELKERQANKPESLNSGYTIGGEPLLLPSGAISILTAPTSHGKTTFLINMALNVAQSNPDTETYLFSYEEDGDSILINTLNTYLDEEISSNNRRTLKSYFTTGSIEYIKSQSKDYFTSTKDKFFRELIETRRLNIHYSSYNSDTIIEAIRYLHKHAKPGAIFIDYIQLLNLPEGKYKTYSRQEEIKEICIALKDVAVETGLPIILGAQFNREVVNQLRIHATKIGEAGDIERIANLIVGFWNNNFKPLATDGELNEINNKGVAPDTLYTTILKNRGGRVGLEEILSFNGNTGKIKNSSSSGSSYFK
jgi:replicative DNA helicase